MLRTVQRRQRVQADCDAEAARFWNHVPLAESALPKK